MKNVKSLLGVSSIFALLFLLFSCGGESSTDSYYPEDYYSDYYCTVTFNSNYPSESGKTNTTATQSVYKYGDTLNENSFVCDGYRFLGWNDTASSNWGRYKNKEEVNFSTDTVLYAVWDKIRDITITFHANDGSESPATATQTASSVASGDKITLNANTFTRTDYVFLGWSTDKTATELSYSSYTDCGEFSISSYTSDTTLYAVWCSKDDARLITITFNANDESTQPATAVQYFKKSDSGANYVTLRKNTFTREGYEFLGWAESASSAKADYSVDGGTYSTISESITLYAVWRDTTHYYITYHSNFNRTSSDSNEETFVQKIDMTETSAVIQKNTFTKSGYYFVGWNTSYYYSTYYYTAEYVPNDTISISGNKDLYAVWIPTSSAIKVTFKANGGSGEDVVQYGVKKPYSYATSYTIKLQKNTFTREHYVFKGWASYESATSATYSDGSSSFSATADTTLYAVWERSEYIVTYNANFIEDGASVAETKTQVVKKANASSAILESNTFENAGKIFLGWNEVKTADEATHSDGDTLSLTDDVTLYAIWLNAEDAVKITLNANDESTTSETISYYVKKNSERKLRANTFSRTGFAFRGWSLEKSDTRPTYSNQATYAIGSENVTFYAIWRSTSVYIVTFEENNGTNSAKSIEIQVSKESEKITGSQISTATADFAKTGYALYGWGASASATSVAYIGSYAYAGSDITVSSDRTVYAIWKETVTVTFNANGGSSASGATSTTQAVFKGASTALTACPFTKSGSIFYGWAKTQSDANDSENFTRDYTDGANVTLSAETTLYAIWKNETESIWFLYNNGTTENTTTETKQIVTATYDTTKNAYVYTTPECKMQNGGYWFAGWAKTRSVSSAYSLYSAGKEQTDLCDWYAIWMPNLYTITYDLNGGSGIAETQQVIVLKESVNAYGTVNATLAAEPVQEGYVFAGWSTNDYSAGDAPLSVLYTQAIKESGSTVSLSGNTTYHAVWLTFVNDCVLAKSTTAGTTYTLTEYRGKSAVLNLASSEMGDRTIDCIYGYAFEDNTSLRRIYFPASITQIGNGAFSGCTGLVKAFHNAASSKVTIESASNKPLTSVLTYNVTYYTNTKHVTNGSGTFLGYFGTAAAFTISDKVDGKEKYTVAPYAFSFNDTLTSLAFNINDDITVQANAVTECSALKTFTIHCTTTIITETATLANGAISNCPALTTYTPTGNLKVYPTSKAAIFVNCPNLK